MVKVFTSRLTRDDDEANAQSQRVNTTVQTGQQGRGSVLAPTWPLVAGHKLHEALQSQNQAEIDRWKTDKVTGQTTEPLDDTAYTTHYLALLRNRYAKDKQPFLDLIQEPQVTLACYCSPGNFCHRHLAVNVLEKIAAVHDIPFERGGEIDSRTGRQWLAPDDPARQQIQVGVVPVISPNGKTSVGFATAALITQADQRRLMEMGHFTPSEQDRAEKYADQVLAYLKREHCITTGRAEDVQDTVGMLAREARDNGLPGLWKPLNPERNEAWAKGDHEITHMPNQMKFPEDRQAISLRLLPIRTPDNLTQIGYAATAFIQQQDSSAMLEVAHFSSKAKERAESYTHDLESNLQKRGYLTVGHNADIEKTVNWLTRRARSNGLNGEWTAMTPEQNLSINTNDLNLTHTYHEVRVIQNVDLYKDSLEL